MSRHLTIRDRIFRGAVIAVVGAVVGFFLMLRLELRRAYWTDSVLLEATLVGAGVGAVLGFILTDYQWMNWIQRMSWTRKR